MAPRVLLLLGMLLLVSLAKVSSDPKTEEEILEEEEELHFPNEPLIVKDGNRRMMQTVDCGGLCKSSCSAHSRPDLCNRACGTCCVRCKCVPPGTSGNREPCGRRYKYNAMTTHDNNATLR